MSDRSRLKLVYRLAALASLALISACGNGGIGSITAVVPTETIPTLSAADAAYTATPGVLAPDATIDIYGSSTADANSDGGSSDLLTTPLGTAETPVNAAIATAACTRLNVNTVTADQLTQNIPDITAQVVQAILAARPYSSVQQLRSAIDATADATVATTYESYLYVPVDPDLADRATLMQLPAVDANVAAGLMSARPFESTDAFLTAISALASPSPQQLADASCFLITQ